jgi:flavorubredoxin
MDRRKIRENVYIIGAVDWERRLFDSLIPLPDGTSYNSYLIFGSEKTALVDSVDPAKAQILLEQLKDVPRIDYVISHHAEQDHSGAIPAVLEKYPWAKVVCTPKDKEMLMDLLLIKEDRFITVDDGNTISLGDKTLKFLHTPWVHWPETMVTYLVEERILFSCDFFGSHLSTTDMYVVDESLVYEAAKRYYSEIMMPFRNIIRKNIEKIRQYPIDVIAPSHGPMYDKPDFIIDAYEDWTSENPENIVVIPYISMHGSTKAMVDYLTNSLVKRGITVQLFDLAVTDIGKLAISLVDAATIVIGTPTFHYGPHPNVFYATYLANAVRPKAKFASIIGSYGWSTQVIDKISGLISNLKLEVIPPVLSKGYPKDKDFEALDNLAKEIYEKHAQLNLQSQSRVCSIVTTCVALT